MQLVYHTPINYCSVTFQNEPWSFLTVCEFFGRDFKDYSPTPPHPVYRSVPGITTAMNSEDASEYDVCLLLWHCNCVYWEQLQGDDVLCKYIAVNLKKGNSSQSVIYIKFIEYMTVGNVLAKGRLYWRNILVF